VGWVKFENSIGGHRKSLELTEDLFLPALGMLLVTVAYCDQQRSDGYIPTKALPRICYGDFQTSIDELVRVGYLDEVDGGYQVHNYLDWQTSAAEIEAKSEMQREKARRKWELARAAAGNAAGITAGYADQTGHDSYVFDSDVTQPLPDSQLRDLQAVAGTQHLGLDEIEKLTNAFGYDITLEAIRRAKDKASKGEYVRKPYALIRSIAENLERDGRVSV
jgi:hypothetical protein